MKVASEEEKRMLGGITHNFMSDEEDGDDKDVWVVRSPSWRSRQLNTLLSRLQERASSQETASRHPKNKRVRGRSSARPSPLNAPAWALNTATTDVPEEPVEPDLEEPEEPMEPVEESDLEPPLAAQCSTPHSNRSNAPTLTTNDDENDDEMMASLRRKKKSGKRKRRL